jgi:TPR repeat protein
MALTEVMPKALTISFLLGFTCLGVKSAEIPNGSAQASKATPTASVTSDLPGIPDSEEFRAFKEALQKAEDGDSKAQCVIGLSYLVGSEKKGIQKNEATAEAWYLKAAKQGNKTAFKQLREIHGRRAGELRAKGKSDTEEVAEFLKFGLLLGRDQDLLSSEISDSTKAEAKRRAAKFRQENGLPAASGASR